MRTQIGLLWVGVAIALCLAIGVMLAHPFLWMIPIGIVILLLATYLAFNYPRVTVVITVLLTIIPLQLQIIIREFNYAIDIGPIKLRFWDPMLFGILMTIFLKLFDKNFQLKLWKYYPSLILFLGFLIIRVLLCLQTYGVNALGEFRTYYGYLFMILYLAIYMKSPEKRLKMLKTLIFLSLSLILIAFVTAILSHEVALKVRWIGSYGALWILHGLVALFILTNKQKINLILFVLAFLAGGFLIVFTAHRSVWLATVIALLILYLLKEIKVTRQVQIALIALIAGSLTYFAFHSVGYNPQEFVATRLLAFTDPEQDPNTYWRQYLWLASLEEIQRNPWLGNGLGKHFQLIDPAGNLITTSPHNLYVSIPFQIGIPGLILYLMFIGTLFIQFMRFRTYPFIPIGDQAIVTIGIVVLTAVSAYYVAYTMEWDWMSWTYIGLATSAISNRSLSLKNKNSVR